LMVLCLCVEPSLGGIALAQDTAAAAAAADHAPLLLPPPPEFKDNVTPEEDGADGQDEVNVCPELQSLSSRCRDRVVMDGVATIVDGCLRDGAGLSACRVPADVVSKELSCPLGMSCVDLTVLAPSLQSQIQTELPRGSTMNFVDIAKRTHKRIKSALLEDQTGDVQRREPVINSTQSTDVDDSWKGVEGTISTWCDAVEPQSNDSSVSHSGDVVCQTEEDEKTPFTFSIAGGTSAWTVKCSSREVANCVCVKVVSTEKSGLEDSDCGRGISLKGFKPGVLSLNSPSHPSLSVCCGVKFSDVFQEWQEGIQRVDETITRNPNDVPLKRDEDMAWRAHQPMEDMEDMFEFFLYKPERITQSVGQCLYRALGFLLIAASAIIVNTRLLNSVPKMKEILLKKAYHERRYACMGSGRPSSYCTPLAIKYAQFVVSKSNFSYRRLFRGIVNFFLLLSSVDFVFTSSMCFGLFT